MTALTSFLKLPAKDKKLLLETLFLMIQVRLMLWILPFSRIKTSFTEEKVTGDRDVTVCTLSWSLKVISHYMPGSTCLTNALTGHRLLSKHGYNGLIKIGVGKSAEGEFEAHAWLEFKDRVIIGESETEYVMLYDFKG